MAGITVISQVALTEGFDVDVIVVLPAFKAAADTIRDRKDEVLNYFLNRAIYASAESQNSKIKQFRAQLRGVINIDFFLYRLSMIYR
jgi:transposase